MSNACLVRETLLSLAILLNVQNSPAVQRDNEHLAKECAQLQAIEKEKADKADKASKKKSD